MTDEIFGSDRGAIYGLPGVPERWRLWWLGARTPVKGLWLAGADAVGHGIIGAMMGGVMASADVLGLRGFPRIFRAAKAFPTAAALQEDVSSLERLQRLAPDVARGSAPIEDAEAHRSADENAWPPHCRCPFRDLKRGNPA
ncbi:MAG TPA: hypothetical protein VKM54_12500 [Myxococcota bacterium]|nr:hypothetical protein [Myxococcota bacterium]